MNNQKRQALIARIEELQEQQGSHWTGNYPGHDLDLKIWNLALTALTAEPVNDEQAYLADDYYGDPIDVFARGANWMLNKIQS